MSDSCVATSDCAQSCRGGHGVGGVGGGAAHAGAVRLPSPRLPERLPQLRRRHSLRQLLAVLLAGLSLQLCSLLLMATVSLVARQVLHPSMRPWPPASRLGEASYSASCVCVRANPAA